MKISKGLNAKKHVFLTIFLILILALVLSYAIITTGLVDKIIGSFSEEFNPIKTWGNGQTNQSIKPEIQISKFFGFKTVVMNEKGTVLYIGTDDAEAIRLALNAVDNGVITFSCGTYYIDSTVLLKSNVSLIGETGVIFKCFNGDGFDTGTNGYSLSTSLLSNDVHLGETQIHVNTVGLNVGDYVKISDNYCISNDENDFRSTAPDNEKIYYKNGELVKVIGINGTSITINRPLSDTYLMTREAKIKKITLLKNIEVKNINFIGSGMETSSTAIKFYGVQNCDISNCGFTDFGDRALNFCDCLDCVLEDNVFKRVFKTGTGYSMAFCNACDNMTVINNSFLEKGRHYIAVGGQTGTEISDGMCRNVNVKNNIFENSTDEAINTHTPNRATFVITGNRFLNCREGIEFSNTNSIIINNTFVDCLNGIKTIGYGSHLIEGNYFQENEIACTLESSSLIEGNLFDNGGYIEPRYNVVISNNNFTNYSDSYIDSRGDVGDFSKNITIINNKFENKISMPIKLIYCKDISLINNELKGYIEFGKCSNVNISNNNITSSDITGIRISDAEGACTITLNNITANGEGILLENSGKNTIKDQIVIKNNNISAPKEVYNDGYTNVISDYALDK